MKARTIFYLIALVIFVLFVLYGIHLNNIANDNYRAMTFYGVVEHVGYDEKGFPEVTINGQHYFLDITWDNSDRNIIEQGDSLMKYRGQTTIKLIKYKNGKTLLFNQN